MTDAEKCEMLRDEVAGLSTTLDTEGYASVGYKGQPTAHWALAQRRASLRLLYVIEARMARSDDLDDELEAFLSAEA